MIKETLHEWSAGKSPAIYRLSRVDNVNLRFSRLNDDGTEVEGVTFLDSFASTLGDALRSVAH